MTSFLPVEARRLHGRPVRLRDGTTLVEASVFPYFDSTGTVTSLMLVWPASPSILMLEMAPGRVRVPWFGPIEIDVDLARLADADATRATTLAGGFWHWDPWWVLKAARYTGQTPVPVLKATNCVHRLPEGVAGCYCARDLTRVVGFARKGALRAEVQIDASLMDSLPASGSERPKLALDASPAGWRLDPFWLRQPWGRGARCR